jgi:hypothetical protein
MHAYHSVIRKIQLTNTHVAKSWGILPRSYFFSYLNTIEDLFLVLNQL